MDTMDGAADDATVPVALKCPAAVTLPVKHAAEACHCTRVPSAQFYQFLNNMLHPLGNNECSSNPCHPDKRILEKNIVQKHLQNVGSRASLGTASHTKQEIMGFREIVLHDILTYAPSARMSFSKRSMPF